MKMQILLAMAILCFASCTKNNNEQMLIETDFSILITNINQEDLLSPSATGTFNSDNIKLFYLINGEKIEYYKSNYDNPKGYFIDSTNGRWGITLTPNDDPSSDYPITYIKWNETDEDTIKCQFKRGEGYCRISKIIFNDKIVWDNNGPRYFEIIK